MSDEGLAIVLVVGALILCLALTIWPISYYGSKAEIAAFKAVQSSMERARQNRSISLIELAALQQKVIDSNKWLAKKQYWNSTLFGWYIPDEVDQLQPIR